MRLLSLLFALGAGGLVGTVNGNDTTAKYVIGACLVMVGYCLGRIHEISKQEEERKGERR